MISEFKKFALRGNVVNLAVGFTVGAAFTTTVKSIVDDVVMPPIGLVLGQSDFSDLFLVLRDGSASPSPYATLQAAREAGAVTVNYGVFLNSFIAFLVVALAVFFLIRAINRLEDRMEEQFGEEAKKPDEPETKKCEFCRSVIPFRARRCPHCTSQLERVAPQAS
jgi:large conductance mechanosensitive channel